MPGNIIITDVDGTILNETNLVLVEEQVASEDLFDHLITISGQIYYVSSFLKWSSINNGTAATVFNRIPGLISVSDFNGNIYYGNSSLTSTLTTLTDEAVYKIVRSRGARDTQLRLQNGQKITHTSSDGSVNLGFDYQFSASGENWFPWCINRQRPIINVLAGNLDKINTIEDSFGNIFQPNQNNTNSLFYFKPGQGYIIDVKQNFSAVFLERQDVSGFNDAQIPSFVPPPRIVAPNSFSNTVSLSISPDNLNTAISQIPKHSLISALEVSTVNAVIADDSTFPGAGEIKAFHGARGQQTTFDALMANNDTSSGESVAIYNRLDFQALFNAQLLALQSRQVKYVIKAVNSFNQLISNTITLSALDLQRLDANIFLNIQNPITTINSNNKNIVFIIETDGVARKYLFLNVDKKEYNGDVTSSINPANASNPVFPKAIEVDAVKWKGNENLKFENLYCTNPT